MNYNFGAPGQDDAGWLWIPALLFVAMFGGIAFAMWIGGKP